MAARSSNGTDGPPPRAEGAVENCVAEAAYHVSEAKRLFEELLSAQTEQGQPVVQITCTIDGKARNHINILRHHLEEALTNVTREKSYLRRLRLDQQTFQELFTENLRLHYDYLLENRRVASAREALHRALKEQAKLHRELQAERSKSKKLDKENKKLKRQLEETEQQFRRASGARRAPEPTPYHPSSVSSSSVLERLQPNEPEPIFVDEERPLGGSSPTSAGSAAAGSVRKRPRMEAGEALVGKVITKTFEGAGMFWGEIIDYDESTGLYRVAYEDGDREDFEFSELDGLIVEPAAWRLPEAAKQRALKEMWRETGRRPSEQRDGQQYLDRRGNHQGGHR